MKARAVSYALLSAVLFGASTPAAKALLADVDQRLAGLLYCGAGLGVSLVLFVLALRHLGTARTGAYFSTAPFLGAAASVAFLGEPLTAQLMAGAAFMAAGVWLHLSEHHEHEHGHEALAHSHPHVHDEHHQHGHEPDVTDTEPHTHWHEHAPLIHAHPHMPDMHHRHDH